MKKEKVKVNKYETYKKTLPHIKKEDLTIDNTWDLFFKLLSSYYDILDTKKINHDDLTEAQQTLMGYNILYGEITTGGFLQLIKNGYGGYIFEHIFTQTLKGWGAIEMSGLIDKAKEIYFHKKIELEIASATQEIFEMYQHYPELNILDKEFFKIMNSEADKIKRYIQNNINEFAIVT